MYPYRKFGYALIILGVITVFAFPAAGFGILVGIALALIGAYAVVGVRDIARSRYTEPEEPIAIESETEAEEVPQAMREVIREKEIVREIVKIRCRHCGTTFEERLDRCPNCGAPA